LYTITARKTPAASPTSLWMEKGSVLQGFPDPLTQSPERKINTKSNPVPATLTCVVLIFNSLYQLMIGWETAKAKAVLAPTERCCQ
jgi:hypothetical protein